ncbi:MAG: hypothetical protein M1571_02520 [Firmicutes bacterium]|jgi:hypothetical protein|nr:hypothetical protein [Bacillota bacterium]
MGKWLEICKDNAQKSIEPALQRQNFVQNLCRQLDQGGTARFHSEKLNETIFILKDWDKLPSLPKNALAFSLTELQNMMSQSYSAAGLTALAQAKRELLAVHRQSMDPLATFEDALKIFPGSRVVDAASKNPSKEV